MGRPRAFYTTTASLSDGIVETRALPTHTTDDPLVCPQGLIRVTGLGTAAIRMMQPPGGGTTTSQSPPQRVLNPERSKRAAHRPSPHVPGLPVPQRRHRHPALRRPHITAIASPPVSGLGHVTLAGAQGRRDRLAMVPGCGDRAAPRGTLPHHPCLGQHPSRLRPSYGAPLVLERCGQAAPASPVPPGGRNRLHPGSQADGLRIERRAGMSSQRRLQPTAADLEPLPEDGDRPGGLMRGEPGIPQGDPLAKKPRAFVTRSRARRRRFFLSRHRWTAALSAAIRPCPGNAVRVVVSNSRFQRPHLLTLSPRVRAVSATPSPGSVTRRLAARWHASV